jgi:hypothetical protein
MVSMKVGKEDIAYLFRGKALLLYLREGIFLLSQCYRSYPAIETKRKGGCFREEMMGIPCVKQHGSQSGVHDE